MSEPDRGRAPRNVTVTFFTEGSFPVPSFSRFSPSSFPSFIPEALGNELRSHSSPLQLPSGRNIKKQKLCWSSRDSVVTRSSIQSIQWFIRSDWEIHRVKV
ncbi:hypothetical protein QTP70_011134 [Hemibagrus guttatus]|uniref:Uncharacterized protein n=1 Tax=Hemibagrus guttatus TaxID=175788 RepID=A0AAE0PR08_9TELE|nr:hypothetical protein QTP70_011134 [Hemibagrus guttatus]